MSVTTFGSSARTHHASLTFNHSLDKYGGLLPPSQYKKLRNSLSNLFNYIFRVWSVPIIIHWIVSILRVIQFIGPVLHGGSTKLWIEDSTDLRALSYIACIYQITPFKYDYDASIYFLYVYISIQIIVTVIMMSASFSFNKKAHIPFTLSVVLAIYFSTICYLFSVIAASHIGTNLGLVIFEHDQILKRLALSIVAFILLLMFHYFYIFIMGQSLFFRPDSLVSTFPVSSYLVFAATCLISAITKFSYHAPVKFEGAITTVVALIYIISCFFQFLKGGFLKRIISNLVLASSITCFIISIVVTVLIFIGKKGTITLFILLIILFVISYFGSSVLLNYFDNKLIMILDELNEENFVEKMKSPNYFIKLIITSFMFSHPICFQFNLIKEYCMKYPDFTDVWFVFAKFVAIYPEEISNLSWIYFTIKARKIKGLYISTIKRHSILISREREKNLSTELKHKLDYLVKTASSAKGKLRNVFDNVIQGNVSEIEVTARRAFDSIEKTDREFKHLIFQFPNNRFVTRTYSRFAQDVLADHTLARSLHSSSNSLAKGSMVSSDKTHEFGMITFNMLPLSLPVNMRIRNTNSMTSFSTSGEIDLDEIETQINNPNYLADLIKEVKIPATRMCFIWRFFVFIIFIYGLQISFFITLFVCARDSIKPFSHMMNIALSRRISSQITAFSYRYVYQELNIFDPPIEQNIEPIRVGGSWSTREQLSFLLEVGSKALQSLQAFNALKSDNVNINLAREELFGRNLMLMMFRNSTDVYEYQSTVMAGIMNQIIQARKLIEMESINDSILNTPMMLNNIFNTRVIGLSQVSAMNHFLGYVSSVDDRRRRSMIIVQSVVIISSILMNMVPLLIGFYWFPIIRSVVYQCLTYVPKNVVSVVINNLRAINSGDSMSLDLTRNEENTLKILHTSEPSMSFHMNNKVTISFSSILIIFFSTLNVVMFANIMNKQSALLRDYAPHFVYLSCSYSYMIGAMNYIDFIAAAGSTLDRRYLLPGMNFTFMHQRYLAYLNNTRYYYNRARFGSDRHAPLHDFYKGVDDAIGSIVCPSEINTLFDACSCMDVDSIFMIIEPVYSSYLGEFVVNNFTGLINTHDDVFNAFWSLQINPIFNSFYYPLFYSILPYIRKELNDSYKIMIPPFVCAVVITTIFELIALFQIKEVDKHIHQVLTLLLHYDEKSVLSNPKIMTVLEGNFKKNNIIQAKQNEEILNYLHDSLLQLNGETREIELVNSVTEKLFNMDKKDIVGKKFEDICPNRKEITTLDDKRTKIEVHEEIINDKLIVTILDKTKDFELRSMIEEEKVKSHQLLSCVVPNEIISQVQVSERLLCFSVQSATICVLNIVGFNRWCFDKEASEILKTLSNFFKSLDEEVTKNSMITRVKTYGNSYLIAGGLFTPQIQPQEHAETIIAFASRAIEISRRFSFEIRVGIDSDGPVFAGIIRLGLPSFEVIGAPVEFASQLERNAKPMKIYLSRSSYELIYSGSFHIEEEAKFEWKGKSYNTYYVKR